MKINPKYVDKKKIKVLSPATIANLGCGFDVLGLCLNEPSENYELELIENNEHLIEEKSNFNLPLQINKNVSGVALSAFLKEKNISPFSYKLQIEKTIKPGSGLGSSSASAAASVVAMNILLNYPFEKKKLVEFAMQGEALASGVPHADNVAPCIFGGITLVRKIAPLEIIQLYVPKNLFVCVIHPQIELKTIHARAVLKTKIPIHQAIQQWANVGSLVAALYKEDYALIGQSLEDIIVEPQRKKLIPLYDVIKQNAIKNGALGGSISGSGPSIFFLCEGIDNANSVNNAIKNIYKENRIISNTYISAINLKGCTEFF
jgi:homoserine kinase